MEKSKRILNQHLFIRHFVKKFRKFQTDKAILDCFVWTPELFQKINMIFFQPICNTFRMKVLKCIQQRLLHIDALQAKSDHWGSMQTSLGVTACPSIYVCPYAGYPYVEKIEQKTSRSVHTFCFFNSHYCLTRTPIDF